MTPCSCGCAETHEVARRTTADGKLVVLWSDGLVTGFLGFRVRGVGASRSTYEAGKDMEAGWLMLDEVCLYDFAEVGALVHAARRSVRQRLLPAAEFMRRTLGGERFRTVRRGAVVVARREHHHSCPCAQCRGARLSPGWIPGAVKYAR